MPFCRSIAAQAQQSEAHLRRVHRLECRRMCFLRGRPLWSCRTAHRMRGTWALSQTPQQCAATPARQRGLCHPQIENESHVQPSAAAWTTMDEVPRILWLHEHSCQWDPFGARYLADHSHNLMTSHKR